MREGGEMREMRKGEKGKEYMCERMREGSKECNEKERRHHYHQQQPSQNINNNHHTAQPNNNDTTPASNNNNNNNNNNSNKQHKYGRTIRAATTVPAVVFLFFRRERGMSSNNAVAQNQSQIGTSAVPPTLLGNLKKDTRTVICPLDALRVEFRYSVFSLE